MSQFYLLTFGKMRHLAPVDLTSLTVGDRALIKAHVVGWGDNSLDALTLMLDAVPRVVTLEEGLAELRKAAAQN